MSSDSGLSQLEYQQNMNRKYLKLCEELSKERHELKQQLCEFEIEVNQLLSERDSVLRENQSMFDKNDTLKKELEKVAKSKDDYAKECEILRKNLELMRSENDFMQSNEDLISDKDKMAYLSLEVANQEVEKLKKLVEKGKMDVARANQEVEIAKGRRDWAISEREKIVQERDSMRNLCDELRKERDTSTSRLLSAIRDKDEAMKKIEFLNEKLESLSNRKKSAEYKSFKSSNIDFEEEIEVNVSHLLVNADLGLTLQCNPENAEFNNNNSYPRVVHVEPDSIFLGKLFKGDNIQYVNGIDCSTLSQRMLFKTIRTSAPTCKMTVKRAKQFEKDICSVKLKNIKTSGLTFDMGVYIRDIKMNSLAYFEPMISVGDRVLQINNHSLENIKNFEDLGEFLVKIENEENTSLKLEKVYSSNRFSSVLQQPTNRWSKMINSSTQTGSDGNSFIYNSMNVPFTPTSDIHDQEVSSNYSNASLPSPSSSKPMAKFFQKFKKIRKPKDAHESDALAVLDSILDSQDSWDGKDKKKNKYKKMIAKSWPREAINNNASENSQTGTIVFKRNKDRPRLFLINSEDHANNNNESSRKKKDEIEDQMVNKLFTRPVIQPAHPHPHPHPHTHPTLPTVSKRSSTFQPFNTVSPPNFQRLISDKSQYGYSDSMDLKRRSLNFSASGVRSNFHRNSFTPIKAISSPTSGTPMDEIHSVSLSSDKYLNEHKYDEFKDIDKNHMITHSITHRSSPHRNINRSSGGFESLPFSDMNHMKYSSPIMYPNEMSVQKNNSNMYSSIRSSQNSSTDGSLNFDKMKLQDSKEEMSSYRVAQSSFHEIGTFPRKNLMQKSIKTSNNSLDYSTTTERASPLPKFQVQIVKQGKSSVLTNRNTFGGLGSHYKPNIGEQRRVNIEKSDKPLGISIKCKKGRGVFVSEVIENSIARQVGLQVGDQLLEFCHINMRLATYDLAAKFLRECGDSITMLVQYNPLKYEELSGSDEDSTPQNSPKAMRSMMSEDSLQNLKHLSISHLQQPSCIQHPLHATSNGTLKKNTNPSHKMLSESSSMGKEQPRVIYIETKKTHNLGVSLLGGNAYGIFIHSVQKNSIADEVGLRVGDQILEYNGTDLRHATAEYAAFELAKPNDRVSAVVQYNIQKFNKIKNEPGDSFYIRVGFDRNSEGNDSELSFSKDDVLYIDNTMLGGVAGQWRAWKLDDNGCRLHCGIIPSQMKVDEELRLAGDASETDSTSNRRSSNSSARRSFFKRMKPQRTSTRDSKELASFNNTHLSLFFESQALDEAMSSYQRVERLDYKFRPILVIGALRDWVVEKLVIDFPEQFRRCEVNRMKCSKEEIESQLKDNSILEYRKRGSSFELVSLQAVKENSESHCILDVNISTIERLHKNNIYPIVVLLKFKSSKHIKEIKDSRYGNTTLFSSKQAKEMYEHALKVESEYKSYISVVIQGVNITHMSTQIKTSVDTEQKKILWVPLKENL